MNLQDTRGQVTSDYIEPMLSIIYHYFEYRPMGLYSRGLIFKLFFVKKSLGLYSRGLIIEGAYTRKFTVF